MMKELALILFIAASASQLAACYLENRRWRSINKPFLLIFLIAWYLLSAPAPQPLLVAALALSLAGDVLLITKKLFMLGGAAFFLAHVCYIAVFALAAGHGGFGLVDGFALVLYGTLLCLELHAVRRGMKPKAFPTAIIYLGTLCFMGFFALRLAAATAGAALPVYLGSLFFLASDFLIALREYRKDLAIPRANFFVMLTYIPAQFLIVWGFLQL